MKAFGLEFENFKKGNYFIHKGVFKDLFLSYGLETTDKFIHVLERTKNSQLAEIHKSEDCYALKSPINKRISSQSQYRLDKLQMFLVR